VWLARVRDYVAVYLVETKWMSEKEVRQKLEVINEKGAV